MGESGTILHYDGESWQKIPTDTDQTLRGVYSFSERDAWVVGAEGVALHYDGVSMSRVETGTKETLYSVWGSSANEVFFAGAHTTLLRFNGKTVQKIDLPGERPNLTLHALFGFAWDNVWAAGTDGLVRHYDGANWVKGSVAAYPNDFRAVFGSRPSAVWLAAGTPYSGRMYYVTSSALPLTDRSLHSVTGNPSALYGFGVADVWAGTVPGALFRYDGRTWKKQKDNIPCHGLWGSAPNDLWSVGPSGHIAHFDGSKWTGYGEPVGLSVVALWAQRPRQIWAIRGTERLRLTPKGWSVDKLPVTSPPRAMVALSDRDVWLAGEGATLRHFDGTKWQVHNLASRGAAGFSAFWASSARDVWAVGSFGTVAHFTGQEWAVLSKPTSESLLAVDGSSARDIWAVGIRGESVHFDGEQWAGITTGVTDHLHGVSSCGPRNAWAVGIKGTIIHWDGARWQRIEGPAKTALNGVLCRNEKDVWVVGDQGLVLRFDGRTWKQLKSGTSHDLTQLLYDGRGVWVASRQGAILSVR